MGRRVLVTVLDWGLGHATRCIPVIRALLSERHEVFIGGSGSSLALLREEFPLQKFITLPAYDPSYPKKWGMIWKMTLQLPKFISAIRSEHDVVETFVKENEIDLIISDNRYGCWSEEVESVLITHQSNILMPKRFGWLSPWVRKTNESLIGKFDACWVPDYPPPHSLAGELISFEEMKFPGRVDFIGNLSRFRRVDASSTGKYDVLAICSGPEPQRSLLEKLLTSQLKRSGLQYLLVRGVIEKGRDGSNINFLTSDELEEAMSESTVVISRSGYSTIMDLKAMGKKAILIPTPGQTEQEYLAARLKEKRIAYSMEQAKFDLDVALRESQGFSGFQRESREDLLMPAISRVLAEISLR